MASFEQIKNYQEENRNRIAKSIIGAYVTDLSFFEKGKKMPIGTVTNGYRKFGEGDWRKVTEGRTSSSDKVSNEGGVTPVEAQAVTSYTESKYREINRALWSGKDHEMEGVINSALEKMESHVGVVYRAASPYKDIEDHFNEFDNKLGDLYKFDAFVSTTSNRKTADNFGSEILFEIKSKNGKKIKQYSDAPHEDEVLFKSKTQFEVLSVKKEKFRVGSLKGKTASITIKLIEV